MTELATKDPPETPNTEIFTTISEDTSEIATDNKTENSNEKKENIETNELKQEENNTNNENQNDTKNTQNVQTQTPTTNTTAANNSSPPTTSNKNTTTNATTSKPVQSTNTNTNNSTTTSTPPTNNTPTQSKPTSNEKMINVKLASGQIISVGLEEYVIGVVGAEMPAEFQTEALKAQAVASRTYALKRTASGGALSASTSDQTFCTIDQLKAQWGGSFDKYYNKVKSAVNATKGQTLKYNGSYIEALFFSTSNGRTEDSVNVWGNSYAYLKSVDSPWDTNASSFSKEKTISMSEISSKLGVNITSVSQINITGRTVGNRVSNVNICGKDYTGVKLRQLLGLRSADFEVYQSGNSIVFTTKGYGHGVGMSQYGANGMAKAGYSYTQILKHYYTGVTIS